MKVAALALFLASSLLPAPPVSAEEPTERYAPAQLGVARQMLERARSAALRGDARVAAQLAWQASLDARLAWTMTERDPLRAEAAVVSREAQMLVTKLAARP